MGPTGIKQALKNLNPQQIAQLRNQLLSESAEQLGLSADQVLGILQALEEERPEPGVVQGQPQAGLYPPHLADGVTQLLANCTTVFGANAPQGTAERYQEMPRRKQFAEPMNVGDPESEMMAIQERVDVLERERAHLLQQLHSTDQQTYSQHPMTSPDMNPQHAKRPRMDESFGFQEPGYQGGFEGGQAFMGGGGGGGSSGVAVSQVNQQRGGSQNTGRGNNRRNKQWKKHSQGQQQQPERGYQVASGAAQDRNQDTGWEQHAGGKYNKDRGGKQANIGRGRGQGQGRGRGRGAGRGQGQGRGRGRGQGQGKGRGQGQGKGWGQGQGRGKQQAGNRQDERGSSRTKNKFLKDRENNRGKNRGGGKPRSLGDTGRDPMERKSNSQSERRSRTGSRDRFRDRSRSHERHSQDDFIGFSQEGPDDYYSNRESFPFGEDNMNPQDVYPDYEGERGHFKQDAFMGDNYISFGDGDYRDDSYRDEAREDNRSYRRDSSHYEDDVRREEDWRDYQPAPREEFVQDDLYRDEDRRESGRSRRDSFHDDKFSKDGRDRSRRQKKERSRRKRSRDHSSRDNRRQSNEYVEDYQRDFASEQRDRRPSWEESRDRGYAYDRQADTRIWDDENAEMERRHWEEEMHRKQESIENAVKMEMMSLRSHQSPVLLEPPRVSLSSPPGIFHPPPMIPDMVSQHSPQFGDGLFPLPPRTVPSLLSIKTKQPFQIGRGRSRYTGLRRGRGQVSYTRARNIEEMRKETASRVTEEFAKLLLKRPVEKLSKRDGKMKEKKDEMKEKEDEKMETDAPKGKDKKEAEGAAKSAETKDAPKEYQMRSLVHQVKILESRELQGFLHLKVVTLGMCYICNTKQSTYEAYKVHTSSNQHKMKMRNFFSNSSYNERERIVARLRQLPFHNAVTPQQLKTHPQGVRVYFCSCCCSGYVSSTEDHQETNNHKHFKAERLQCTACNMYFYKLTSFRKHLQGELHKKIAEMLKTKGDKQKGPQKQQDKTDVPKQKSVAKKVNKATAEAEPKGRKGEQKATSQKPRTAPSSSAASSKSQGAVVKSSTVPSAKSSTPALCTETDKDVVGLDLVVPVSGFFCKCCSKFYNDKFTAKTSHCTTELHKRKALEWYKTEAKKVDPSASQSKKTQEVIVIDDDDDDDDKKKSKIQVGNDKMETSTIQRIKPTKEQDDCKQKAAASDDACESLEEGELMSPKELHGKDIKPREMETESETKDRPEAMDVDKEGKSLSSEKRDPASAVHSKVSPKDSGSQEGKDGDTSSVQKQTGVGKEAEKATDDVSQGDYLYGDLEEQTHQKEEGYEHRYLQFVGKETRDEELSDAGDDDDMFAIDEAGWEIRSEEGGCVMMSDEEQPGDDGEEDAGDNGKKDGKNDAGDDGKDAEDDGKEDVGGDGKEDAGDDGKEDAGDDEVQGNTGQGQMGDDSKDDGKGDDSRDDGKGDDSRDDGKGDDSKDDGKGDDSKDDGVQAAGDDLKEECKEPVVEADKSNDVTP